jgi:hypothetical protein
VYYIVQENIFRDYNYNNLTIALDRLQLPYEVVSIYSGREDIIFETDRKDVFVFGGLKMARIAKQYEWKPGSMMNSNHDFEVYKEYYKDGLLNFDSNIIKFGDVYFELPEKFFARPTKDTKSFTGKIYTKEEWLYFRDDALKYKRHSLLYSETMVQISSVKDIQQEIRVWIVKGEVITQSQYKLGNQVLYDEMVDVSVIDYCKEMIKIYQPADAFVMDICLVDNTYKIIEINCINCSGFYKADLQKLIMSLEYNF